MKIIEIKSASVNIIVKTRVVRSSTNLRVGTIIKTALLPTLDRRGLGTYFRGVC